MNKILHVQVKTFITCSEAEKKIMLAKKTRNVFEIKKKVQNARCSVHTWKLSSGDCQVSASNCKLVSRNKLRRYPDFALWRSFSRAWALVPAFVYLMKCIVSVSDAFPNSHTKLGGFGGGWLQSWAGLGGEYTEVINFTRGWCTRPRTWIHLTLRWSEVFVTATVEIVFVLNREQ